MSPSEIHPGQEVLRIDISGGEQVVHGNLHQLLPLDGGFLHELGASTVKHVHVNVSDGPEASSLHQNGLTSQGFRGLKHILLRTKHHGIG